VQRIGIFGGSFDPVHLGHLLAAQAACEELELERFFFIPAAQSPFKPESTPAPASARVRLLRLALAGKCRYEVDTQEVERGGVSYTVDTLRDYVRRFAGAALYYLIGADHVEQLPQWREAEALAKLATFVVIPRPGEEVERAPQPFQIRSLAGFPLGVSSSQIRARIQGGLPVDHLTPPFVAEAIADNGLYL
jgi:nicotinate-nucleotide adenylyltransferase